MSIDCLIGLIICAIVIIVLLWVIDLVVTAIMKTSLPAPINMLIRVLGLLIWLLYALRCFGVLGTGPPLVR